MNQTFSLNPDCIDKEAILNPKLIISVSKGQFHTVSLIKHDDIFVALCSVVVILSVD